LKLKLHDYMVENNLIDQKKDRKIVKDLNEDCDNLIELKDKRGNLIYRQNSFKRLLKNDSLKYHEHGMKEVFEEFQKYSIKS